MTRSDVRRTRYQRAINFRPDSRHRERGLSIIESLVVLLVSSLLLSILLPTAIQSMSANLRIGEAGLQQLRQSLDERGFRRLVNAAVPARQARGQRPVRLTLRGDAERITMTVLAREGVACAPPQREISVILKIENNEDGEGGRLVCALLEADDGRSAQTLASWRDGKGAFAYSLEGGTWRADWPDPELFEREEKAIVSTSDLSTVTQPLVLAPLVRFTVSGNRNSVWVERAGAAEPVQIRLDGELLTSRASVSP